jgi:hypothetical protein
VVVLVERDGQVVCKPFDRATTEEISKYLFESIHRLAALMTYENSVYNRPGRRFFGGH